jgi:hypothetical protein
MPVEMLIWPYAFVITPRLGVKCIAIACVPPRVGVLRRSCAPISTTRSFDVQLPLVGADGTEALPIATETADCVRDALTPLATPDIESVTRALEPVKGGVPVSVTEPLPLETVELAVKPAVGVLADTVMPVQADDGFPLQEIGIVTLGRLSVRVLGVALPTVSVAELLAAGVQLTVVKLNDGPDVL